MKLKNGQNNNFLEKTFHPFLKVTKKATHHHFLLMIFWGVNIEST